MTSRGVPWRLVLATAAFAVFAPGGLPLAGLAYAGLVVAAPGMPARSRVVAAGLAAVSGALLVAPGGGVLDGVLAAFTLVTAAAFIAGAWAMPAPFLAQALRALAIGVAGTAGLVWAGAAPGWGELGWEAARAVSEQTAGLVAIAPDLAGTRLVATRVLTDTLPALTVLSALAALAVAWQWHARTAPRPLGPALAPFREFRIADGWVWAVIAALAAWAVPPLAALKGAALNVGVVLGALYLLRGAAVVAALAGGAGLSSGALVLAAVVAGVLAVPLVIVVPGLWALGLSDTWIEFRRRRKSGASTR